MVIFVLNRYTDRAYERGRADGISSMQEQVIKAEAKVAEMERQAFETAAKHAEQMSQASEEYQKLLAEQSQKEKVRYVEVQKIVEKPVYRNLCFDDVGLSELNRAIKGE